MEKIELLLSTGSIPWSGIVQAQKIASKTGFDGVELVPTRKIFHEVDSFMQKTPSHLHSYLSHVKGLHQSWRLDLGNDRQYEIGPFVSFLATAIRYAFFPSITSTTALIGALSRTLTIPVTVHGITPQWTADNDGQEFVGGILYELIGSYAVEPHSIRKWLEEKNHGIVMDTRDDQSLRWAKHHGFATWRQLWEWIGVKNIKNIQLTLLGKRGVGNIFNKQPTLAEEEFLFLHKNAWNGSITVEVNPLLLFLYGRGNIHTSLTTLAEFVKTTVIKGKKWSH